MKSAKPGGADAARQAFALTIGHLSRYKATKKVKCFDVAGSRLTLSSIQNHRVADGQEHFSLYLCGL